MRTALAFAVAILLATACGQEIVSMESIPDGGSTIPCPDGYPLDCGDPMQHCCAAGQPYWCVHLQKCAEIQEFCFGDEYYLCRR